MLAGARDGQRQSPTRFSARCTFITKANAFGGGMSKRWVSAMRKETTAIYLQAMGSEEREIAARVCSDLVN